MNNRTMLNFRQKKKHPTEKHLSKKHPMKKRFVSIRWTLPIYLLLPLVSGIVLTGWIAFRSGQRAVYEIVDQLGFEVANNINNQVNEYLSKPVVVSELLLVQARSGKLETGNVRQIGKGIQEITQSDLLVNNLFYGSDNGTFTYSEYINGESRLDYLDRLTQFKRIAYRVDDNGNTGFVLSVSNYNHKERVWYQDAVAQKKPIWSQVYVSKARSGLTLTRATPVFTASGELEGVFGVDVYLSELSDFLRQLRIGETGDAFVVESSGSLIATSANEAPFIVNNQQTDRRLASESQDSAIRAAALHLSDQAADLGNLDRETSLAFELEGERYISYVYPLKESFGVDWLIVVVIPENDFLDAINQRKRQITVVGTAISVVASFLALATARSIIRPINQINQAALDVERNDYQPGVLDPVINRTDEFSKLATIFNDMAEVVSSREQTLSEQVDDLKTKIDSYGSLKEQHFSHAHQVENLLEQVRAIRTSL